MTDKTVADGNEQGRLPDELRGQFHVRTRELERRLDEGTLDFRSTMNGLQLLIEAKHDKFRFFTYLGLVVHPDGRRFRVEAYEHTRGNMVTTSAERLAFLASHGATLLGQLGLDLLGGPDKTNVPAGWYASYTDGDDIFLAILEVCLSRDLWNVRLGRFRCRWNDDFKLLCFIEV